MTKVTSQEETGGGMGRSKAQNTYMRVIGKIFSGLGVLSYIVFGLWGTLISLSIVHDATNFWGFVAACVFFPVAFAVAPLYALFHWGTWFPLAITYGGMIGSGILRMVGDSLNSD